MPGFTVSSRRSSRIASDPSRVLVLLPTTCASLPHAELSRDDRGRRGFAVACAPRHPLLPPVVPPSTERGLVVTLAWSAPVDLDLYVTMPSGETIYYANPREAFVRDARCADGAGGSRMEQVRWRSPAPGRYRLGVDFPEACAEGVDVAAYRLVVDLDGARVDHGGTARLLVRDPWVTEIDVP